MPARLKQRLRDHADHWLFQLRAHEPGEVFLNQRRVFIVPTRAGLWFALLLLIMFIGTVNYNLGLGFALTFTTAACGVIGMVLTSRNLARLHLAPGRAEPVFAGQEARFELQVINRSHHDRYAIHIDFLAAGAPRHVIDVAAGARATLTLACASGARGMLVAPRVRLLTRFPLGLFQAWSYWTPDARALVYPCPEPENAAAPLPLEAAAGAEGGGQAGHDEFAGIRAYQPGDTPRQLAWRQIARLDPALGGALVSKHFGGGAAAGLTLDFDALPADLDPEARLARMTRWVLEAERRQLPYAFRLGHERLPPALGPAQRDTCLRALALYGLARPA